MKKKVLFYIKNLANGAGKNVVQISNGLSDEYEISIVTSNAQDSLLKKLSPSVKTIFIRKSIFLTFVSLFFIRVFNSFNYAFSSGALNGASVALAFSFSANTKLIIREVSSPKELSESRNIMILRSIKNFMSTYAYKKADLIISPTEVIKDQLIKYWSLPSSKITVVYNGVEEVSQFTVGYSQKDRDFISILSIGNLSNVKNHKLLIDAVDILVREYGVHVQCSILGDGARYEDLKEQINRLSLESEISLEGFVDDKAPYFINSNIFVMTSLYEGFPNVLVEALSHGVPSVVTPFSSGPDEILNSECGKVITSYSSRELAKAILEVSQTSWDASKVRACAARFSVANQISGVKKAIKEIL